MISGIGDVIGHHHGKLEGQCILKGTDIQAKTLLQLFKTVHQSIPVHIELSGGFRKVQVIFKEDPDDIEGFVVNRFQGFFSEDLAYEHVADLSGKLIDQTSDAQTVVTENVFVSIKDLADPRAVRASL